MTPVSHPVERALAQKQQQERSRNIGIPGLLKGMSQKKRGERRVGGCLLGLEVFGSGNLEGSTYFRRGGGGRKVITKRAKDYLRPSKKGRGK